MKNGFVRTLAACVLILFFLNTHAQQHTGGYEGYFRKPLDLPLQIVANMGELRANHWHMGLDIRTDQKVNQPVHAAAAGYIAHIGIRSSSFGRFIIINHPNGLSTLYGHLNDFFPALEKYVREQEYAKESWDIELDPDPSMFPVSAGQFIAFSGNTGGSQGPHLHFEIIDTKTTKRLNPLRFGLPLNDNVPPTISRLAIYDRSVSIYDALPKWIALRKSGSGYTTNGGATVKTSSPEFAFGIQATDKVSGSSNPNGIYSARLFLDDKPQVYFAIDSLRYEETGYVNAQTDYRNPSVQLLCRLPGDKGGIIHDITGNGNIHITDTTIHTVRIEVRDVYGNLSTLRFNIQYDPFAAALPKIMTAGANDFAPAQVNVFEKPDFEVYMREENFYDTIHAIYSEENNSNGTIYHFGNPSIPVQGDMTFRIRIPSSIHPADYNRLVITRTGRNRSVKSARIQGQWASVDFSDFGNFQLSVDLQPPSVNSLGSADTINLSASRQIVFTPSDNGGIKGLEAKLDGNWLRFTNDKGHSWIYIFDEHCPYGVHNLQVTVTDIAGNKTIRSWWFRRSPYSAPPPRHGHSKKAKGKTKATHKKTAKKHR